MHQLSYNSCMLIIMKGFDANLISHLPVMKFDINKLSFCCQWIMKWDEEEAVPVNGILFARINVPNFLCDIKSMAEVTTPSIH